ncbi:acyltransferase [Shewanella sp. 10N.286.51.B7]|uniref:acyltransferase family protein n=1 Tax=Shewanella sp. 10N.286.51.B7 TaxID=1880836 RepID=UPI000C850D76|nr:acyltransferase family protein [Shewanella sp. 10N.286.51.B7]PMG73680.1 acyltransferase [Shewanella sp. 10N.286.51.B7]
MHFRQDINGLRAIAVIGVMLFHFQSNWLPGGFAGVDVFFVISGFLMTSIIFKGVENNQFSLLNFYLSRANRIIPPLSVMCLIILFIGGWILTPQEYSALGRHVYSSISFFSNIMYWQESGYFDGSSAYNWLLHTWSLSVEWQFYILYPLFILFLKKISSIDTIKPTLAILTFIFFVFSVFASHNFPNAAYYLLPIRGWEMLVGGLVYLYPISLSKNKSQLVEFVAILLIIVSYLFMSSDTVWPGYYALTPVFGGVLLLYANNQNSFITGNYFFQKIGAASYSIYLWHWPVVVFIHYFDLTITSTIFGFVLSVLFGTLSYNYIEKIKYRKAHTIKEIIKLPSISLAVLTFVIGFLVFYFDGLEIRGSNSNYSLATELERLKPNKGLDSSCDLTFNTSDQCNNSKSPEILIWGDSFAMQLVDGVLSSNPDAQLIQMTKSSCGPIFDAAPVLKGTFATGCLDFTSKVKKWIKQNSSIKYVVMSSPFIQYLEHPVEFADGSQHNIDISELNELFMSTLRFFEKNGIKPIIFSPPPMNGKNLGRCLSTQTYKDADLSYCDFKISELDQIQTVVFNWLDLLSNNYNVVNLKNYFCDDKMCKSHIGNTYLYRDAEHLSKEGSELLGLEKDFYKMIIN